MGCSTGDRECDADEKPLHQVTISKGFWMGETEVTVEAYKRFARMTSRDMPPAQGFNRGWEQDDDLPMVSVTWEDAQAYCRWAGGRLSTEAEGIRSAGRKRQRPLWAARRGGLVRG
jgi:sulfatase modifying factor 1